MAGIPADFKAEVGKRHYVRRGSALGPQRNGRRDMYVIAAKQGKRIWIMWVGYTDGTVITGRTGREAGLPDAYIWADANQFEITWF